MNANEMFEEPCQAHVAKPPHQALPVRTPKILMSLVRILGLFGFMAVALFCVFGFLESFEPGNGGIWKIVYGTLACGSLLAAVALLRGR